MAKAFEAECSIKTSYVRLSSGEAVAKLTADKADPQFSVWWGRPADGHIAAEDIANATIASGQQLPTIAWGSAPALIEGTSVDALVDAADRDVPPEAARKVTRGLVDWNQAGSDREE